jgi:hypothetical protein
MQKKQIRCLKHGLVLGPFCIECRGLRYLEKVKNGKIQPQPLVFIELEPPLKELSILQIRFRAYKLRLQREERRDDSCEIWKRRSRTVRIISTRFLKGLR